jgi:predicted dehydrogenase/threonine dehydrogenase-like Zn-dependent dehydrogenase
MKQAVLSNGTMIARDVPKPNCLTDGALINIEFSCISPGTEISSIINANKSLLKRGLENPKHIKSAIEVLRARGFSTLKNIINGATGASFGKPLGYTAAGVIEEIGSQLDGFYKGQRVAISGVGYANHAGYASVPKNMIVPIPKNLDMEQASTVAIGSIAMQGVRRLIPKQGEKIVVVGLGAIGLITIQLLQASGCTVYGTDIDVGRLEFAKCQYRMKVFNGEDTKLVDKVLMTAEGGGEGVDGIVFTAATNSSEPMSQGFNMLRRKGRFVLVGVSGMEIKREDIYKKELDFRIATSYGPGRYDDVYEKQGLDYPYEYVRWTENRNMQEYLRLLSEGIISVKPLITGVFDVEKVNDAYNSFKVDKKNILVLLDYKRSHKKNPSKDIIYHKNANKGKLKKPSIINYAVVGAGSFVKGMHLPNLQKMPDKFNLKAIMNRSGLPAAALAEQFGAEYSTTNINYILEDSSIDLVLITTRHNSHAKLAIQALKAGKHVFVEKPPALNRQELNDLLLTVKETNKNYLVGYNRRFSKYAIEIKEKLTNRKSEVFINYTMNAGYLPKDHWVHRPEEGGRIVGEGCHIIDLFSYLIGCKIEVYEINHLKMGGGYYLLDDNVTVTIKYKDGSIATMNYFSNGAKSYPKETMKIYFDNSQIVMSDYMSISSSGIKTRKIKDSMPNKGQLHEMKSLYDSIVNGKKYPISLDDIEETSLLTFEIQDKLKNSPNNTW